MGKSGQDPGRKVRPLQPSLYVWSVPCEDIAVGWKSFAMGRELYVCIVLLKRLLIAA